MKKGKLLLICICLCLFVLLNTLNASSAIVYCEKTGIVGYGYGGIVKELVIERAFNMCRQAGGLEPKLMAYNEQLGFAAIAYSEEPKVVGYCLGAAYREIAKGEAIKQCFERGGLKIQCIAEWHDRADKVEIYNFYKHDDSRDYDRRD